MTNVYLQIIPKGYFDDSFRGKPQGLDDDSAKEYLNRMCDLAEAFGANRSEAEKEMRNALQFEISMVEVFVKNVDIGK